jgi:hypothetical protein
MKCSEYKDLVAAHADGQLAGEELGRAERHASTCPPCEALRRAQLAVKALLARHRGRQPAPDSLRAEIARRTVGAAEAGASAPSASSGPGSRKTRILVAGAIAATLLLTLGPLLLGRGDTNLISTMAADIGQIATHSPQLATSSPAELRSYYAHNGLTFDQSVEDLEPYGIHLIGGSVSHVGGVATTLTLYDAAGAPVVCRRFPAGRLGLPSGGRRFNKSELFEHDGVHVAVTKLDNGVICLMASRTPFEKLFASAHANQSVPLR